MTLRKHEVEAILKNCELLEQGAKRYYDEISNLIRRIKEAHVSNETIDEYNCELVNAAIKRFNSESKFAINDITNITPQSKNLSINTNPSKEKIQEFGNAKLYIDDECLCIDIQ